MIIQEISTKKEKKEYLDFLYSIYKNDSNFIDMNVIFVKNFLYKKDKYARRCEIIPFIIKEKEPQVEGMFIIDETSELKLSFLEFLPNTEKYLIELVSYARKLLHKYNKEKLIVGINGQISYGLGILTADYNRNFEFNANYNPAYYTGMLDNIFPIIKRAFSYDYDVYNSVKFFNKDLLEKNYKEFTFRYFDKKHFKRDMLIFGSLCDKALCSTPYYSKKTPYDMYELMKQTFMFFRNEDIIFAMKDNKEIGFLYTHPDYAELFNKGVLNYISFYFKFLRKKPNKVIYNVIGVLPQYQNSGIAMNLIDKSIRTRREAYRYASSSFILEENEESTNLCRKLSTGINKEYHLYELLRED